MVKQIAKCSTKKGYGGIAMVMLDVVLHLCSMVPPVALSKPQQRRSVKTCGSKRWQHGTPRRVVQHAGNMETHKMDSIRLLSMMSLDLGSHAL